MSKFCLVAVPHALISISHCLVFCLIFPQCPAPVGFNWKKEYLICTLILSSLQAPIPLPSSRSHSPRTATSTSILICPPSTANMVGNRYCCSLSLLLLSLWILLTPTESLPFSIRVLLESAVRNCDNFHVLEKDVQSILGWTPSLKQETSDVEVSFKPARVILQVWIIASHRLCLYVTS